MTPSAQHGEPLVINGCLQQGGLRYWRFGAGHADINLEQAQRARDSYNALRSVANPAAIEAHLHAVEALRKGCEAGSVLVDLVMAVIDTFQDLDYQERTAEG